MMSKKYPKNQPQLSSRDYNKNDDPRKPFWNESGFWDRQGKYRSGIPKEERQRKKCEAKTRSGTLCQKWAMKNGRCPIHGGKNVTKYHKRGADPVGDKETIWHDLLTEDESLFVSDLKLDAEILLNEEIKLITVRERRMMQRINDLAEENFSVVKKQRSSEVGVGPGGDINKVTQTDIAESNLSQIQKIEEALTKVQEKKAKLIELKIKVQDVEEGDNGALDGLVAVLEQSKRRLTREKRAAAKKLGEE